MAATAALEERATDPASSRTPVSATRLLKVIACGQLLSLLLCGTGISSTYLANDGVNMPTFQSLLNYLALAIVFGGALVYQGQFWEVFRKRWWIYMLLALVDVEANFLIVKAYQYTTMTSIQVLDCFTIPCVIVLGRVVLKTPFSVLKLVAVLICLGGIACLISADVLTSRNEDAGASNAALGDVFCLLGASLYAVSNIGQEGTVKKFSLTEFLSMIGIFGSVVSGIQSGSLESENIASVEWTGPVVGWLLMYSVCLFVLYTVVPVMLLWSDATMMNLGLLTSDAYTLVFGLFLFAYEFSPLYFVGYAVIGFGLVAFYLVDARESRQAAKMEAEQGEPFLTLPSRAFGFEVIAMRVLSLCCRVQRPFFPALWSPADPQSRKTARTRGCRSCTSDPSWHMGTCAVCCVVPCVLCVR
eukprot:m.510533 g.510533  ORF g.510533 m.510533 type:complete len:415 (+) comp57419_c0_seq2:63-1307(+)